MPPTFYLDLLVVVLLVATIIYGSLLNRKLGALRSNKAELDVLIQSFNDSCQRAEAGVRTLRTATDEATRLQQYLARGQMLRDDLAFLIERGTVLADRLEGGVRSARTETQARPDAPRAAAPAEAPRRQAPAVAAVAPPAPAPAQMVSKPSLALTEGGLEASVEDRPATARPVRERAALRGEGRGEAGAAGAPRSKAERDLLEALRAKR